MVFTIGRMAAIARKAVMGLEVRTVTRRFTTLAREGPHDRLMSLGVREAE